MKTLKRSWREVYEIENSAGKKKITNSDGCTGKNFEKERSLGD